MATSEVVARLEEIEGPDRSSPSRIPLVLIHDGGGTIFQYFLLGSLGRQVYGIGNPYFHDAAKPTGGLPQLAKDYARAIQSEVGHGSIILGGWSFGGMLSVEVARLLQGDHKIRVKGLIMIDSICPWSSNYRSRGRVRPSYRDTTSDAVKEKVNQSFDNAREMILDWDRPPAFDAPPAIMIRASDAMTIKNSPDGVQVTSHSDGRLGWSDYACINFISVVTVAGDHFSMFADDKVSAIPARPVEYGWVRSRQELPADFRDLAS